MLSDSSKVWLGNAWGRVRSWRWGLLLEILLIIAWVLLVGYHLLDMDPNYVIYGSEVPLMSQSHYIWETAQKCGLCVLWNGSLNGGYPAFAETQGAVLHPLVVLTTFFWGVVNGSKMVILGSLILAGVAQWWLALVMGLGRAARVWAALVAAVSGSMIGKMDGGGFIFILSQASASLIFAPIVGLYLHRKRSYIAWLGLLLALTWVSGQGYIQVGVLMAVLPMLLILVITRNGRISPLWKDYALAFALSILLASVFWVPLLHFFPNFTKVADPHLANLQKLGTLLLNLVISDMTYFSTANLGHDMMIYVNYIFIGWIPVTLTILSLYFVPRERSRLMWFLWAVSLSIFVTCSAEYVSFLHRYIHALEYLRFFSVIAGMAVTPLLALAAWSLDEILKRPLPKLVSAGSKGALLNFSLKLVFWLAILAACLIPLTSNILPWLDEVAVDSRNEVVAKLNTGQAKWIAPQREDFFWSSILLDQGLKLTNVYRPWEWKNHQNPPPEVSIIQSANVVEMPNEFARIGVFHLIREPGVHYAFVTSGDEITPCQATALGGNIDVTCTTTQAGTLTVQENFFSGWHLRVDGKKQGLISNQFLSAQAPAGTHHYQFRYRPWDVLVGLLLTLSGIVFIVYLIRSDRKETV